MSKPLYVLFGPPGSGKSTQAGLLADRLGLRYVSWGRIAREIASGKRDGSGCAALLRACIGKNAPIPARITGRIVEDALAEASRDDSLSGIILDGYPRRIEEAKELVRISERHSLKFEAVIRFNIDQETLMERLRGRILCQTCGTSYRGDTKDMRCEKDGAVLARRNDDAPDIARDRYRSYIAEAMDAFETIAAGSAASFDVDASAPELDIFTDIVAKLRSRPKTSYRLHRRTGETRLETDFGEFTLVGYQNAVTYGAHLALVKGAVRGERNVPVRLHSSCITGDVFGSQRCDCGPQLRESLREIDARGSGIVLYLFQEGRGINILNKINAYALQTVGGLDTVEANERLGLPPELRDYSPARDILRDLGVRTIDLMTNNPVKMRELLAEGVIIERRIPLEVPPTAHNIRYRQAQAEKFGHVFSLGASAKLHSESKPAEVELGCVQIDDRVAGLRLGDLRAFPADICRVSSRKGRFAEVPLIPQNAAA